MNAQELTEYIKAGNAEYPADLVIENGTLINVNTSEYYQANVAIYKGKIVAVDKDISAYIGPNTKHIDAHGQYLAPGLIDCHIHVECSKMSMSSFASAVVPFGTTSIVSGLDEYIAAIGLDNLPEILQEVDQSPLKVFWNLPYKTPYTIPASTISYNVHGEDHDKFQALPQCHGVWETVREAVATHDQDTLAALLAAMKNHKPILGCSPLTTGRALNEFLMSGVRVDHESYGSAEFLEKARKGVHTVIRESSVTKFLHENIRAITENAAGVARHTSFCTDDVNAHDILDHGHIDHMVRLAIQAGVSPMTAIQMATINGAEANQIDDQVGSITPGKDADILLVDNPGSFHVQAVIAKGRLTAKEHTLTAPIVPPKRSQQLLGTMHHATVTADDFATRVKVQQGVADVETIKSVGPFMRKRRDVKLTVADGIVEPNADKDVALVSVVERYGKNGNISHGFISGWSLQKGAIASSAAPDDNNIVVAGVNRDDMALAVNTLLKCGGGQVVVADGQVKVLLKLPIGGLVSDLSPADLAKAEVDLKGAARDLGSQLPDPLFYLSFLPITAIPDLAITDCGNVDYPHLKFFDPILDIQQK